jgi:ABC-type lipoprotein release transport system permease subunit
MPGRLETLGILVQIAVRNLFASRLKTLIVGSIISVGAIIVVVGSSLVDSIDAGMRGSFINSVTGHAQIFNKNSKDDLAIYGGMTGDSDLKPLEDFAQVKKAVLAVPNVEAVIPMGIADAMVGAGNELDRALEKLRSLVRRIEGGDASEGTRAQYQATQDHLRTMLQRLQKGFATVREIADEKSLDIQAMADLERAQSDAFWGGFEKDPLGNLEFLENKIAPQGLEGDMIYLRYVGTDLESFRKAFPRFELVEGSLVPPGQRGILLAKLYIDEWLKLRTAYRMDKIQEGLTIGRRTIAKDEELERFVRENAAQTREILMQLDSIKTLEMTSRLQKALGSKEADLQALLVELLTTDDANFAERYRIFYDQVVPLVQLYKVLVGDTITIKAFTRAGYMKAVNVKVYGVYQFRGLEKSTFAGIMCLMDLMSFRDLYGYLTADKAEEIKKIKLAAGVKQIAREDAEAELFGGGATPAADPLLAVGFDDAAEIEKGGKLIREDLTARVYTQQEIDQGVAINAAVLLKDPKRLDETMRAIDSAGGAAGLPLKVINWQRATGMIGQFVVFARLVLYTAVLIIFIVALVIINNAMVMATLQRVKEIGTLRAIGAQKRTILGMLFVETVAVGLLFGLVGAALGAGIVEALHVYGIPARSQELFFFFSGPRLHPTLAGANLVIALVIVLLVSIASGFYPAFLAMRITPLEAMQDEE